MQQSEWLAVHTHHDRSILGWGEMPLLDKFASVLDDMEKQHGNCTMVVIVQATDDFIEAVARFENA